LGSSNRRSGGILFEPKPFEQIRDAEWERFFEVNVLSGIRLATELLRARTDRQLDGEDAPVSHAFTWRDLPAGEYTIRATLSYTQRPAVHAARMMKVLGGPENPGIAGRP
jgi:NAD(P)-dependent dehydrogenase (short-subunit alcohol dehydrogenase family)